MKEIQQITSQNVTAYMILNKSKQKKNGSMKNVQVLKTVEQM